MISRIAKQMKCTSFIVGVLLLPVIAIGLFEALKTRTIRAELPNGVYFHNIMFRSWDDNLVMRAADGHIVVPADVVRVKHSDTHVYVAHRDKGYRDAHNFYVYEVATDTLTLCSRFWSRFEGEPSCESLLAATGIDPDDTDEPNSIGGWLDWRYLSGSDYEFRRYWWQPGSAAALWRRMRETMNCAAVQPPSATRSR